MKKLKGGLFMNLWYPDINGVILVMENLMKNMSEYADITFAVLRTGSEDNDKELFNSVKKTAKKDLVMSWKDIAKKHIIITMK